jgi:putative transcriptional regulator
MRRNAPKKGDLLIAEPSIIGDSSFNRSVILITQHTQEEGTVGFILNKALDYKLSDVITNTNIDFKLYIGGPVEQNNLYYIHTKPELIPNSIEISNGIFWAGDFEDALLLIEDGIITENDIKFFLGYSGWDSHQLEQELLDKTWILSENNHKTKIIQESNAAFWKNYMRSLGNDYSIWSNAPENPAFN